jgi:hypothetical protein
MTQPTQKLCDKVAEALLVKIGVVDNEPALRGARRLRELGFNQTADLEHYASTEVAKYEQRKVTNVNTNTRS